MDSPTSKARIMSSTIETNAIYMVAYFRPYPPGDPFHWGLFVKTRGGSPDTGTLFLAIQNPSWTYQTKVHAVRHSQSAVAAAKIGFVPSGTTDQELKALLASVSVGESQNYSGEWRCNIWVRDAVHLLVSKG
jgi:hypothetical protein